MSEHDWRRKAIYWRFCAGDGVQAIADAWGIGLEQVEDELRAELRADAPTCVPAPAPARQPSVPRATAKPAAKPARTKASTPRTDWQQKALDVLAKMPHNAPVGELITKMRLPDAERKVATTRLWSALQTLVKHGQVERHGTRYQLPRKEAA